jgi:NAD(P)-dependent dehydrogenase (short-subunit alcohol dehydrogenase family)
VLNPLLCYSEVWQRKPLIPGRPQSQVNSVHPGLVGDTPAWENAPERIEAVVSKTPTKRITHTEDVVHTVLFLFDNLGINAVELFVDGGVRVQPMM